MIEPRRAVVRPRVYIPGADGSAPLDDEISARLDAFVNPGGRMNPDNERRLLDYMEANGIARNTGTTSFIFGKQFQAARKDAAKHFGLI
jgi:hypothetical protein